MKILLIRHGEVKETYQERFIGSTDAPLSQSGRADCLNLRKSLESYHIEMFYCSPLRRAIETLEIIKSDKAPTKIDPRLREIDFGLWENLRFDEITQKATPKQLDIWANQPMQMVFPGGESYAEFANRVDEFIKELLHSSFKRVALVTHGGVLMRMISTWKNIPPERQYEVLPPRGSLTIMER
ncbi:MAG: alpha-ribazole phosphatase family protein [Victivallales bacterium]|jgi:alpha-ribazole phosphatase|nr:alpha-ribazole phosphatase family protein [Victivallales bacterium]